jgi:hypothetical protein
MVRSYLERGNLGLKGWDVEIDWHVRVGGYGGKIKR